MHAAVSIDLEPALNTGYGQGCNRYVISHTNKQSVAQDLQFVLLLHSCLNIESGQLLMLSGDTSISLCRHKGLRHPKLSSV